jgi:hypothetical protein
MTESRAYAVDRLFQDALSAALNRHEHGGSLMKIAAAFSADERRQLSAAIAEVIKTEVPPEHLDFETSDAERLSPAGLDSAILKMRRDGAVDKIVFLRVKDTVSDAVLPLLGLAVAAWGGDVSKLIAPAAQSIKSVWTNLVTLTRKKDGVAIDVYEALTISRALSREAAGGFPTTSEITARLDEAPATVVAALKRLVKLKLIEIQTWGGDTDDESHSGNTWRVRL